MVCAAILDRKCSSNTFDREHGQRLQNTLNLKRDGEREKGCAGSYISSMWRNACPPTQSNECTVRTDGYSHGLGFDDDSDQALMEALMMMIGCQEVLFETFLFLYRCPMYAMYSPAHPLPLCYFAVFFQFPSVPQMVAVSGA